MPKLIFFYIIFLVFIVLFSYSFVDQNLGYLKPLYTGFYTSHRFITTLIFLFIVIIYFVFYAIFLRRIKKGMLNSKQIIFLTAFILFFAYPAILSYDIFNYVMTSKVLFGYHENPYIFTPLQFTGDSFLEFTRATNKVALYGLFWILVSAVPYILGVGNFLLTLFGFKAIAAFFYLATSFLILKVTKNKLSVAVFALNPLVIIESLVSAHNDVFMMFFALLSLYLLSKGQKIRAFIFLFLSAMVKYATIFLFPVFIYTLWKIIRGKVINLGTTYLLASISMFTIFFLSSIREEIYPWYGMWFLVFISTIPHRRVLLYVSIGFSIGLLLSYIPYMFSGNYFGLTPYIKNLLIFAPPVASLVFALRRRIWLKRFFWR